MVTPVRRCPGCQYDLAGLVGVARCPECGGNPHGPRREQAGPRGVLAMIGLLVPATIVLLVMYGISPADKFGMPEGARATALRALAFALVATGVLLGFAGQRSRYGSVAFALLAIIAATALTVLLDSLLWVSCLIFGW